ncbi:hypothetical protein RSOLAG1IB_03006 [Rhizoctonia solani AG-1 IB]|uniref:Uncharacterized protein n=1 Tax=Thanatephorus cucumeris (strain AG1-IB / isolate 7/3/14) TaxID=1108050 RepID=A0A0B7FKQ6_THACB|nr:hypothetical protein RSOLAG1IB_03006 [Rhizoctonia solani AG-1 IB]
MVNPTSCSICNFGPDSANIHTHPELSDCFITQSQRIYQNKCHYGICLGNRAGCRCKHRHERPRFLTTTTPPSGLLEATRVSGL